jgi:tetrahydromethanopterin S-methyltransferase subunit A
MTGNRTTHETAGLTAAVSRLQEAAGAKKCWTCGCLHSSLKAIDYAFRDSQPPAELSEAIEAARKRLEPVGYDCLGCKVCYPALAINALAQGAAGDALDLAMCPTEAMEARDGWPPLPGAYTVLRYRASVAACTLTDEHLATAIARTAPPDVALVGTLQTENLGIERLIRNVLANPYIRFLIVSGADSTQAIGHLPGQSLVALAHAGLDERSRIVGARGRRPVLRNVSSEAVQHFRRTVEVVDLVGHAHLSAILDTAHDCAGRNPGPAVAFAPERVIAPLTGYLPRHMIPAPEGYFIIYVDHAHGALSLEHYRKDGFFDTVIEGREAAELYTPAIDRGLVSRLNHAAYLGRELARAEQALIAGTRYVQDAAPERGRSPTAPDCGCGSAGAAPTG